MTHEGRPSWWLVDGEERSSAAPRSFFIPPAERRAGLAACRTVTVEIGFEPVTIDDALWLSERAKVRIDQVDEHGRYRGRLRDTPAVAPELEAGDALVFGPEHVVGIDYLRNELVYDPAAQAAVDPRALYDVAPTKVQRVRPPGNATRVWLLTLDGELPPHLWVLPLGQLVDFWPELGPVFVAGEGDWVRHPRRAEYVRSHAGDPAPHQRAAIEALVDAAMLCVRYPTDPHAAKSEARLEQALEDVIDAHWSQIGVGRPDGVSHPGVRRVDGRIQVTGKLWVRDAPARSVALDLSPETGGTLLLGEAPQAARRWRGMRRRAVVDPAAAESLVTIALPAAR